MNKALYTKRLSGIIESKDTERKIFTLTIREYLGNGAILFLIPSVQK